LSTVLAEFYFNCKMLLLFWHKEVECLYDVAWYAHSVKW